MSAVGAELTAEVGLVAGEWEAEELAVAATAAAPPATVVTELATAAAVALEAFAPGELVVVGALLERATLAVAAMVVAASVVVASVVAVLVAGGWEVG